MVFLGCSTSFAIGHMRSPDLTKIRCFKSANQLCMLDVVYEAITSVNSHLDIHQSTIVTEDDHLRHFY